MNFYCFTCFTPFVTLRVPPLPEGEAYGCCYFQCSAVVMIEIFQRSLHLIRRCTKLRFAMLHLQASVDHRQPDDCHLLRGRLFALAEIIKVLSVNKIYYTAQITALLRGIKVIVFPFLGVILSKLSSLYGQALLNLMLQFIPFVNAGSSIV